MAGEQRLMTRAQAATYCHLSQSAFSEWVSRGRLPTALFGTRRWDRRALDVALDKLSGLSNRSSSLDDEDRAEAALEAWRRESA